MQVSRLIQYPLGLLRVLVTQAANVFPPTAITHLNQFPISSPSLGFDSRLLCCLFQAADYYDRITQCLKKYSIHISYINVMNCLPPHSLSSSFPGLGSSEPPCPAASQGAPDPGQSQGARSASSLWNPTISSTGAAAPARTPAMRSDVWTRWS